MTSGKPLAFSEPPVSPLLRTKSPNSGSKEGPKPGLRRGWQMGVVVPPGRHIRRALLSMVGLLWLESDGPVWKGLMSGRQEEGSLVT